MLRHSTDDDSSAAKSIIACHGTILCYVSKTGQMFSLLHVSDKAPRGMRTHWKKTWLHRESNLISPTIPISILIDSDCWKLVRRQPFQYIYIASIDLYSNYCYLNADENARAWERRLRTGTRGDRFSQSARVKVNGRSLLTGRECTLFRFDRLNRGAPGAIDQWKCAANNHRRGVSRKLELQATMIKY